MASLDCIGTLSFPMAQRFCNAVVWVAKLVRVKEVGNYFNYFILV